MLDEMDHAKVCDFGLAKPFTVDLGEGLGEGLDEGLDEASATNAIGTLRYMAPEVHARATLTSPLMRTRFSPGPATSPKLSQPTGPHTHRELSPCPTHQVIQRTEREVTVRYNEAADAYSFGLLLWEMATRRTVFAEYNGVTVATQLAPSGQRPSLQLPTGVSALGKLIRECWHEDPRQRPTMAACTEHLLRLVNTLGAGDPHSSSGDLSEPVESVSNADTMLDHEGGAGLSGDEAAALGQSETSAPEPSRNPSPPLELTVR
jgi:serine/threonine protein kinase